MATRIKQFARKVVGADKDPQVGVVRTVDVLKANGTKPVPFVLNYLKSLFPILSWIGKYNLGWLSGDLIAGITVGVILIPQSMSYAKIATLPPEYGLYSSFIGVFIYCLFATSKDISIGPVAVMSLEVANIIAHVNAKHPGVWTAPHIATTVALLCGFITLGIGLLRLGWIVEFIPVPAVAGFMTGSALTIISQQLPGLMGIQTRFTNRASFYHEIIWFFQNLKYTTLDAAFGLSGLAAVYTILYGTRYLAGRYPSRAKLFFFLGTARNAVVILVLTLASWLYARHRKDANGNYPISVLKTVPRGLQHVGVPTIDTTLASAIAPELPVATIILLLEHIAIGKSFGRLNGYKINPNQELVAIGVTNCVGSFFSAYPSTGSFSRTAVKSKSGVRTPLAGVFVGILVIIALYALTSAFFWIPNAALCAVIIAAVGDLVASPRVIYNFWRVSPFECLIWWASVIITVFSSIENGIYASVCASAALLLVRLARPRGRFLGRVLVRQGDSKAVREVFVPMEEPAAGHAIVNPKLKIEPPAPGIVVYRPEESVLYPNSSLVTDRLVDWVRENTRRGKDMTGVSLALRPWNDPGPRSGHFQPSPEELAKPILRAVVFDFTAVSNIDTTAVQALIDTRNELERWADRPVSFYFCHVISPWVRRGLVAGGFGVADDERERERIPVEIAPIAGPIGDTDNADGFLYRDRRAEQKSPMDEEASISIQPSPTAASSQTNVQIDFEGSVVHTLTPYFHFDVASAVNAAELEVLELSPRSSNDGDGDVKDSKSPFVIEELESKEVQSF